MQILHRLNLISISKLFVLFPLADQKASRTDTPEYYRNARYDVIIPEVTPVRVVGKPQFMFQ